MKILLITPSDQRKGFEYVQSGRENLGVEYLLSAVRNAGFNAESVNQNLLGEKNLNDIDLTDYFVIGFSLPFWEYKNQYIDLINDVSLNTEAYLIAGGHAATIGAEYFLHACPVLKGHCNG